ncbi:DinB family protein [Bacillus infantis]|uniref:DinB family protein n=1 Tax=Bacillus infantis TaxID=324767 RepID=UPI0021557801|nr:DinB family protein [Bacillus infantis]MCR6609607.1 DinB family protein [Bacillus infantis]
MEERIVMDSYKQSLGKYTVEQLRKIPADGVWSLAQMYDHVIVVAHEYLDEAEACAAVDPVQSRGKTEFGEKLFRDGGFPPVKIRLPDEMNQPPDNSGTPASLLERLAELEKRMEGVGKKLHKVHSNLKREHGGFGWLNAKEWHQLAEMHFRHHLRQKGELEERLGIEKYE